MRFNLPRPLSVNRMFGNSAKGRRITAEYAEWRRVAMAEIMAQRVGQVLPQWPVSITITLPDSNGRADIGNFEKGVTDALVEMAIIPDDTDRYVKRIVLQLGAQSGRADVEISSV